ncbi:hypothetical protein GCM10022377_26760 [Zhihengliuella alba]|uniref:Uncharacterized protein n=1 Tax=Zhihengliuella alba TaxID=547018 RepID=A0ABP7DYL7_9MICC
MRLSTRTKQGAGASLEERFAPHVDRKWAGDLILELRLLGVDGSRIGDVLAEVDSHCAESGEGAAGAFGDPVAYARSLDLPSEEDSAGDMLRAVVPVLIQTLGMLLLLWSFTDWRRGGVFEITAGGTLLAVAMVVESVAIGLLAQRLLRFMVSHPVLTVAGFMLNTAAVAVPAVLWDDVVAELPPVWGLVLGVLALLGGLAWQFIGRTGLQTPEDPIESPLSGTDVGADPEGSAPARTRGRAARVPQVLLSLQLPIATALLLAFTWWFTR